MPTAAERLNHWLETFPYQWLARSEADLSHKPLPHVWSKKEILGHLCDSAVNNHNRFVRIQFEQSPFVIARYNQNHWVKVNAYQNRPIDGILSLWIVMNKHILSVISQVTEEQSSLPCDIGEDKLATYQWLIDDYVDHMEHHLNQIIQPGS